MSGFRGQHTRPCLPLPLCDIMLREKENVGNFKDILTSPGLVILMLKEKRCTWPEPTVIRGRKMEPVQCVKLHICNDLEQFTPECKHKKISKMTRRTCKKRLVKTTGMVVLDKVEEVKLSR